MLQTLLWSRMTCSSTFLKYPFAVLTQTPAAYILMYCNAFSTTFTAVRCFQLRKKVLRLDATSYQSSDRSVQHLCLWLQNEHERHFCEEFAPQPGGTNDNDAHVCERTAVKVAENALQYIKTAKDILKCRGTSHSTEQGLEQLIVLLKLKSTF